MEIRKIYNLRSAAMMLLSAMFCLSIVSCGSDDDDTAIAKIPASASGIFTDSRDGNVYKWVRYGDLDWMAENFRYEIDNDAQCILYENASGVAMDANKYGRLYTYTAALSACPEGWRLPTDEDWQNLEQQLGMSAADAASYDWRGNIAKRMMTIYGDSCDLNLILGGYYTDNTIMGTSGFRFMGVYAYYWTATPDTVKGEGFYFFRKLIYNSDAVNRQSMEPGQFLSVRYVRDSE